MSNAVRRVNAARGELRVRDDRDLGYYYDFIWYLIDRNHRFTEGSIDRGDRFMVMSDLICDAVIDPGGAGSDAYLIMDPRGHIGYLRSILYEKTVFIGMCQRR